MPKFEFNPRTGMMEPKKDDQIYFAQSQGGGLRIDDYKNNVKYIIERDGRITNLAGIRDGIVNLYDMRNARIIADRVIRMFGRNHKYSDFHYFLKGYKVGESIIKKFDEYINEGLFTDTIKRGYTGDVRKEIGFVIGLLEDGKKLIVPNEARENGEPVDFDGQKIYCFNEELEEYIAVFTESGIDTYYRYDNECAERVNMVEIFSADEKIRDNDFEILKAYMNASEKALSELDGMEVDAESSHMVTFRNDDTWEVWDDEDSVQNHAIELEKSILDSCYDFKDKKSMEKVVNDWRNNFGDDFIDVKSIEDSLRESYEYSFDDMESNDLIDDLLAYNIIEDTEEYFELDGDGEPDHDLPKFEPEDYKDAYVEYIMKQINDVVDEYLLNYGFEGFENYIDFDKVAELIVKKYGRGPIISGYDGDEKTETINGTTYYIYRIE